MLRAGPSLHCCLTYLVQPSLSVQIHDQSTVREERGPRRFGRVVKLWYVIHLISSLLPRQLTWFLSQWMTIRNTR